MKYAELKAYLKKYFHGWSPPDDTGKYAKIQADAESLKNTLSTTGWSKLSDRLSESFVDGLSEIFTKLRDGSYDKDKLLVQTAIVLSRLELINQINLMLEDGKTAGEELNKQANPQSIEELAQT